jgi:predicted choloylglycine hydrolase
MEIYPDSGYTTMVIGVHEINSVLDGPNSEGLGIKILQDPSLEPMANTSFAGNRNSGILGLHMVRLVLETCRNVEGAKIAFLAMGGIHLPGGHQTASHEDTL